MQGIERLSYAASQSDRGLLFAGLFLLALFIIATLVGSFAAIILKLFCKCEGDHLKVTQQVTTKTVG